MEWVMFATQSRLCIFSLYHNFYYKSKKLELYAKL